jgi:type IV secretion system protein VirB1
MKGRRFALYALLIGAASAGASEAAYRAGLRINTTPSMPVGLWAVSEPGTVLEHGQGVSLCPEDDAAFRLAKARGYLPAGRCAGDYEPLFKPVVAVAGDWVTVTTAGLAVNGVPVPNSRAAPADARGRAMPVIAPGTYPVAPGTMWVVSSFHPASFDSRYFGPLPVTQVEGIARPLWVKGCAPNVAPTTIRKIIQVESQGNRLALHVNGGSVPRAAVDASDAAQLAQAAIDAGQSVDLGLMQVNSRNLPALGYTVEQMFDSCLNLRAGAAILTANYTAAAQRYGDGQDALRAALSAYNTGNFQDRFRNGYVAKYDGPQGVRAAFSIRRPQTLPPPTPYTADTTVYFRDQEAPR